MKIRFIENYETKATPSVSYEIGQVIDCNNATGAHFINKGLAVEHEVTEVKPEPKKPVVEESSTGGSLPQDPASPEKTPAKRGRPRKQKVAKSSSSTTTTDTLT